MFVFINALILEYILRIKLMPGVSENVYLPSFYKVLCGFSTQQGRMDIFHS
ncbi:hypothetical protein SAMN04488057_105258 [Cyclobacterium lianum]|uniref:Uncharacterized protein n=1 Tax=Cyclobacterium lianum TaxID=388280 RepID=A0A1M7NFS8_9BACT|nr:hypothetical protein SAMN04488057_105258 [Cyclobacterium lianum]